MNRYALLPVQRRWFAVLSVVLLLCVAGVPAITAASAVNPEPGADRAPIAGEWQQEDPPDPSEVELAADGGPQLASNLVDTGLIAHWKLDETSGHPYDSSPYHRYTYLYGGAYTTEHAPTVLENPRSLRFTAANHDYFYGSNPGLANTSFSLAAWARRDGSGAQVIMSHGTSTSPGRTLEFGFRADNRFVCGFSEATPLLTDGPISETGWHHWACTFNNSTNERRLYRDGVLIAADIATIDYVGAGDLVVGVLMGTPYGAYFNGWIDEARVYNGALSAADVARLGQPKRRPVAYWMLNGSGHDSSARNFYPLSGSGPTFTTTGGAPLPFTNAGYASFAAATSMTVEPYLHTSGDSELQPPGEFSVSAWVRPGSGSANRSLVTGEGYSLRLEGGVAKVMMSVPGGSPLTVTGGSVPANQWTHVAFTYRRGDQLRLYVNGQQVGAATAGAVSMGSTGQTWVGGSIACGFSTCTAVDMDDVRIYRRQLGAHEIHGLGDATKYCYAFPNDTWEGTDGTVYATHNTDAVQAAIDLLGPLGGTVKLSGNCSGVNTVSGTAQIMLIPSFDYPAAAVTIEGGWNQYFTAQNSTTSLDAAFAGRGLYAPGTIGSLTLRRLEVTRGRALNTAGSKGGGILTAMPTTLDQVQVTNSDTQGDGGGIAATAPLTMTGCTVSGNQAGASGLGGGVWANRFTISNSQIIANTALSGGGLYDSSYGSGASSVTSSTFNSNAATDGGGIFSMQGALTLTDVTLSYNRASLGGGLRTYQGSATINAGRFSTNTATGLGGAIYLESTNLTVTRAQLDGNQAPSGAALYHNTGGTTNIVNSTISRNTGTSAGALYMNGGGLNLTFATVTDNQGAAGAGLYVASGATKVTSSIIARNRTGATTYGADVYGGATLTSGGGNVIGAGSTNRFTAAWDQINVADPKLDALQNGVYPLLPESPARDAAVCTVAGTTITLDQAGQARPGGTETIYCDAGASEAQDTAATCFAKTTTGEFRSANARGIQEAEDEAAAGTTIKVAGRCKGAQYADGGYQTLSLQKNLTIEGGYLPGAWATPDPAANRTFLDGADRERVISTGTGTNVTLRHLNITGGRAAQGAGVYGRGTLSLANSSVYLNTATSTGAAGAGLYNTGTASVVGSAVYNNAAAGGWGGGIYNYGGTLNVTNTTVATNSASSGGGLANENGSANVVASTLTGNSASASGGNIYKRGTGSITLTATAISAPAAGGNCSTSLVSGGYNRISDASCLGSPLGTDLVNAVIRLDALAYNGASTLNYLPQSTADNSILDMIPQSMCEQFLGTSPVDQRGRTRPRLGLAEHERLCDAGAVERGQETWMVCGPPLDPGSADSAGRCQQPTIAAALAEASDDDIVVVAGVVTETVSIDKNVTLRGPRLFEVTPGTHMGVLQGAIAKPSGSCTGASVVTIASGKSVTIEDLNIRHGCATNGGGINNAGTLRLVRSTVYDNRGTMGGGVYNSGTLQIADSTLSGNSSSNGGGVFNAAGGSLAVRRSTLANNSGGTTSGSISNSGTATIGGSILSAAGTTGSQCTGTLTAEARNLVHGPGCTVSGIASITGDPSLGPLRDNGGPTLTYAIPANGLAVDSGYAATDASCAGTLDQRGRLRPSAPGYGCDLGAYEYGSRTMTVDAAAQPDAAAGLYNNLQQALDASMTGDVVKVRAGTYTGNFVAYRDVTIEHAGVDVRLLSPELGYDVRAILQASSRTVDEQNRLGSPAGTTLTVQAYAPTGTSVEPTGSVSVTLRSLTIRRGSGLTGGGVNNRGDLTIERSTIEGNAALISGTTGGLGGGIHNTGELSLLLSTISGNRAEQFGGALYNAGAGESSPAAARIVASTLADNQASLLPDQHLVVVDGGSLAPASLTVASGDEVRFENRTGQPHTMSLVSPVPGVSCSPGEIVMPYVGLSGSIVCITDNGVPAGQTRTVTFADTDHLLSLAVTVAAPASAPDGATLYQAGYSRTDLNRSILYHTSATRACSRPASASNAQIFSDGTNLFKPEPGEVDDSSCFPMGDALADPLLSPLQDNNVIDYAAGTISGYSYTHATQPRSPAIDALPPSACGASVVRVDIDQLTPAVGASTTVVAGDIVEWVSSSARSVMLKDGEYDERLLEVSPNRVAVRVQLTGVGLLSYRVYDAESREVGYGTVLVNQHQDWSADQRGFPLPQRGREPTYACDIGAYEFAAWVVGQPLPRPPAASGTNPQWTINDIPLQGYHAWSSATRQDYPLRPTRPAMGGIAVETATTRWTVGASGSGDRSLTQTGIVVWPDTPQLHVSGAAVNLSHSGVSDGFNVSPGDARAYEGYEQVDELAGALVSNNVFTRSILTAQAGDSYSVLQFLKSTQSSTSLKVSVIKSVAWDAAGIRDLRDRETRDGYNLTDCIVGSELMYPQFTDAAGTLPGHSDPEGRPGWILEGAAYDGVRTQAELVSAGNTVDNRVPPAHVRELRQGPIIPVLDIAPAEGEADSRTADDLRVAWYRPDSRNIAWPVKSAAYRCRWPVDSQTPEIVIASELGSEIGGQVLLSPSRFAEPTVYHQPDAGMPGYFPNYEHALLSSSNLGNPEPALYGLRTDLAKRNTGDGVDRSYALLKYRDAQLGNRTQIAVYRVVLTQAPADVPYQAIPGTISAAGAGTQPAPAGGTLTLRVGNGISLNGAPVTVPIEAVHAVGLASGAVEVSYDSALLQPVKCEPDRTKIVERPWEPALETDDYVLVGRVVHMRASTRAGTDLRYLWDFGDGTQQYDDREVSHVYSSAADYQVTVTISNGFFTEAVSRTGTVHVLATQTIPFDGLDAEGERTGCRISTPGKLVLDFVTRNKHGLRADATLADVTFEPLTTLTTTPVQVLDTSALATADYTDLVYSLEAGLPVYAPTPMRALLDIQPCKQTQAEETAIPFWKDWKNMLWARAAGDMSVQYFYPLQPGFYLDPDYAAQHGLPADEAERAGVCVPWLDTLDTALYPEGTTTVEYVDEAGGNQVRTVYPVGYRVSWPELPALLNVGETVFQKAKGGVSAVGSQVAVTRIYDDLAPGAWDNEIGSVVLDATGVYTSLAELIDPLGEVEVELPVWVGGNPSLPTDITSQRLLFGGGVGLLGNAGDPNLALPFSLRSRIVFREAAVDIDGDESYNGTLVFKGYYDGASPEYIKGDPLLLLNVMSDADRQRLLNLCTTAGAECDAYAAAIENLYRKSRNPRELDLCRNELGGAYPGDPDPAEQLAWDETNGAMSGCDPIDGVDYWRDGVADQAFLIAAQDVDADGHPEPFEGLGKGKALTAGNAAGTGFITVAYNNDSSLGALPVSLQVIKVECAKNQLGDDSPYRGNLLVIKSDSLFDEKLTLRHTGDFGGRPDHFLFDWWIAPVDDTGVSPTLAPPGYPWQKWTRLEPGASAHGPEITIEGANVTTLRDNWVLVRYLNTRCAVCGNNYIWSALAGDPSAKPTEVRAQLAEGWIKRVTNALNPFDARVDDFVSAPTNSTADMVRQAGRRYEGPIAMNNDPETLNAVGLIEAYQTVLERGRDLSIDAGVNDQGANAALLNVTSRLSSLYLLLANDAYTDALDPTVGLGTSSSLGVRAPALFAFANQFRPDQFGLIDEELALLRGRDETLGGVAAAPTYNRLTWNFTNGDGEVAYVMNYNIKDVNQDGFVNEADAALMYPQGHGDAWGHFLTALTKYYELLRHQNYSWVPRAEPLGVGGAPVVVDYYDERKFATAAAEKARMGAEIVDLTYRKNHAEPGSQAYVDTHVDASDGTARAWGVADWAQRAGQGAYFDWVVANAILPPQDDRYTDLRKIDRTTVMEIEEIANQYAAIQKQLDDADNQVNPLGLTGDAVLFDLDPALTKTTPTTEGLTHFEQVYQRSLSSLSNALKLYDYANEVKLAQRAAQDQQRDFTLRVIDEDRARVNELIEIFGLPYDADIGVNGTYPAGYAGPDIYNFDLIDRTELTDAEMRCSSAEIEDGNCPAETTTYMLEFGPIECLGSYVETLTAHTYALPFKIEDLCAGQTDAENLEVPYTVGIGLDSGMGRYKPDSWPSASARASWGEIQRKMWGVYDAKIAYESSVIAYQNHGEALAAHYQAMKDRAEYLEKKSRLDTATKSTVLGIDTAVAVAEGVMKTLATLGEDFKAVSWVSSYSLPFVVGIDNDPSALGRAFALIDGLVLGAPMEKAKLVEELAVSAAGLSKQALEMAVEIEMFDEDADLELRQMGREMASLLREERSQRLALYLALDNYYGSWDDYKAEVKHGFRKLEELVLMRKRWAGQVAEQRYGDMAYRVYQNDALLKYRQQFNMAQTYVYLTAAAYDYETNLRGSDLAAGDRFLRDIVGTRSLGELRWTTGPWDVEPIVGSGGLAEPLGKMRDNFVVLKGQMGFNNPQAEANRFSLRHELFRLRDESDATWRQTLARYYTPDVYSNPVVGQLAKRPYGDAGPEPGLVIPFGSTITRRLNFFSNPLGPGDSSYSATQFATKIANVGVWFEGYDTTRLSQTPRVYLLPGGQDVIRPRGTDGVQRYWNVTEQLLPVPYPITRAEMENPNWIPSIDGLQGQFLKIKPYADMRAYPYTADLEPRELNTDTRLIGRSVWNTEWVLVIPGATLLADPDMGIDRFMQDIDDIYVYFQTYAYSGAAAAPDQTAAVEKTAALQPGAAMAAASVTALNPNPMPQPDVILYGVAQRDGAPLASGTLTAILPRLGTVTTEIAPIAGTGYNYSLSVPLAHYDAGDTNYAADFARVGETVQIKIDGLPAVLQDSAGAAYQAYPLGAVGRGYVVTIDASAPGSYPPGDVNASGRRDSADALLVLKYDVGLMTGVTTWPPGPGTIYLPLCDINDDGRCNSTDALRILLCDVGLAACSGGGPATVPAAPSADALPAYLKTVQEVDRAAGQIVVRVQAESPNTPLAVASLDLHFDPAQFSVVACAENPAGRLDLAVCNPAFAADMVRYTGVTTGGIVESAALVEVRLRPLDPAALEPLAQRGLAVDIASAALMDLDGNALRPIIKVEPSFKVTNKVLLPLITQIVGPAPGGPPSASELTPRPRADGRPETAAEFHSEQ